MFFSYLKEKTGTILVAFAVMMPVVVGAVGMSMDLGQAYLVRARLAGALDASALAAAASETEEEAIRTRVEDFFEKNYPEGKIGAPYDLDIAFDGDDVIVSAAADYDTTFMRVLGIDSMTVREETIVRREVRGLEIVMVLDNTGSMAENDNISALIEASENFVNILFDRATNPEDIRIGLVPYANSVRVGRYGLGQNPDGTVYGDGSVFVRLPSGINYTTNYDSGSNWYGCIIEHNEAGWNLQRGDNDPYPMDVSDEYEGLWDIYRYADLDADTNTTCTGRSPNRVCTTTTTYSIDYESPINRGCPKAYIMPLTSDQDALLDRIGDMEPFGNTLGNVGMLWGYKLLSPEAPFTEGTAWNSNQWDKAVIMMTDGVNTRDSKYSYFWLADRHSLSTDDFNERFLEVCSALKAQNVLIYTVTFYSGVDEDTKEYYRQCASTPSQYYDAPTQEDLIGVFERISRELANLHIRG